MKIEISGEGRPITLEYRQPALLSTLIVKAGVRFDLPCGGNRRCKKCKVTVTGAVEPPDAGERALLTDEELSAGVRYACMATACGDVRVQLPKAREGANYIATDAAADMAFDRADVWGRELGAAIDIGTTTVAAYLYRLSDGKTLATAAALNPQTAYGADVVSRLEKALTGDGDGLAASVRGCIGELLGRMCREQGRALSDIDSLAITGNTAMLYLLCGQNPQSIAVAPFEQDRYFGEFLDGDALGIPGLTAKVYLSRCISSYVGGDMTTAALATGMAERTEPTLLVDIGTNGEMMLSVGGRLLCCSTAAGPAFEGAGLAMGMPAKDGAVSHVRFTPHGPDGVPAMECTVLGDEPAVGLCGSGVIDALAAMREAGVVDETGRIQEENHPFVEQVTECAGELRFLLPGTEVAVTQADVRAVQLGKSAICAGILTLLETAGLSCDELTSLVIAGGFGSFLDVKSAERIGLIPEGFAAKATAVGNAAAAGAAMTLRRGPLARAEALARRAETVELSTSPEFMEHYIECMMLP